MFIPGEGPAASALSAAWMFLLKCRKLSPTSTSVPDLVIAIQSSNMDDREQALVKLLQACLNDDQRWQIIEENAVQVLDNLVENCHSHFEQVYAFGCLKLLKRFDLGLPDSQLAELESIITPFSRVQYISLIEAMSDDENPEQVKAVIYCSCIAATIRGSELRTAGVIQPLVKLLCQGNEEVKIWALDALGNLADSADSRVAIVEEGAIVAIVGLLLSGTDQQKAMAAYALHRLSVDNETNSFAIAAHGAVVPLVKLLKVKGEMVKLFATMALDSLTNCDAFRLTIATYGGISSVMELVRTGSDWQKALAIELLRNLEIRDGTCEVIAQAGAIPILKEFLQGGTEKLKDYALFALEYLADNVACIELILSEGIIPILVAMLRNGSDDEKLHVTTILSSLAYEDISSCNRVMVDEGAIPLLVSLLQTGTDDQKTEAALACNNLACISGNGHTIDDLGAILPLVELLQHGIKDQKENAACALSHLAKDAGIRARIPCEKVIPAMVQLLDASNMEEDQELWLSILKLLVLNEANHAVLLREGVVPLCVQFLSSNAGNLKEGQHACLLN